MSSAGKAPSTKSTTLFVCMIRHPCLVQSDKKGLPEVEKEKK